MNRHPAVDACAVAPVPDPIRGDEVFACIKLIKPVDDKAGTATDIVEYCLGQLAYYKAPGWVLFLDSQPTTGTQKIQKTRIFPAGTDPRQMESAIDLRDLKRKKKA